MVVGIGFGWVVEVVDFVCWYVVGVLLWCLVMVLLWCVVNEEYFEYWEIVDVVELCGDVVG